MLCFYFLLNYEMLPLRDQNSNLDTGLSGISFKTILQNFMDGMRANTIYTLPWNFSNEGTCANP